MAGKFLTGASRTVQLSKKGMYRVLDNELYEDDDGAIFLVPRGFETDNFTWIKSNEWDIRCSHLHDVGCKYHQIIKVNLSASQLKLRRLLKERNGITICENIPIQFLQVIDVTGNEINNMFYRMLKNADCPETPKHIQYLYRAGVSFNIGWFWSGKEKIDLKTIYEGER